MNESSLSTPIEFPFPFTPYSIQSEFMRELYATIESRRLGVFESPTGTGKSMSLICGSLKWLFDSEERKKLDIEKQMIEMEEKIACGATSSGGDWLNEHHSIAKARDQKFALDKCRKSIAEMEERIKKLLEMAKCSESIKSTKRKHYAKVKKKGKENITENVLDKQKKQEDVDDDDIVLEGSSNDAKLSGSESEEEEDKKDEQYHCPKIFICSRTHSQLTQLAGEIQKSPFRDQRVRVVCLASRQNMCINDSVLRLNNLSLINEACQDLRSRKSSKTSKMLATGEKVKKQKTCSSGGCPYFSETSMKQLQAEATAEVLDLEELVSAGREISACPYYMARTSIKDAHVVLVPYQTLLHRRTREASGIDVTNSVVIIDEAHNLLDTLANIHSATVSGLQLSHSHSMLLQYRDKFRDRFSPANLLHLNQLIFVVHKLVRLVTKTELNKEGSVSTLSEFLITAEIDNMNLYQLLDFASKSRLANKLRGYVAKYQPTVSLPDKKENVSSRAAFLKSIKNKDAIKPAEVLSTEQPELITGNPILSVVTFIEALTNHYEDVRVVCNIGATPAQSFLKLMVLNPAEHFADIISKARSVIVAGGTMQPFSEFTDQLFSLSGASPTRVHTFSCGHVVPPENILPIILSKGPVGRLLDFSFALRNDTALLDELGRLLINVCSVVPAGMVVFFPSYEYESKVYEYLTAKGIITKLQSKKKVLREPKQSNQVENVLSEYAASASKGALLFSVVGGKLSEGLNFSDDLGRCVIVVGLPYPNKHSPELREKMQYLELNVSKNSGNIYYENLCMKAVNQSIGRSVRHANDYATVLLLDHRYSRPRIQQTLPNWISTRLSIPPQFGPAMSLLAKFFAAKKDPRSVQSSGTVFPTN